MPKISLWKPEQRGDYTYTDRIVREHFNLGATGVYIHKYLGPEIQLGDNNNSSSTNGETDELTIGDVLLLENRNRKYDSSVYELRGSYNPADTDLDLTQFGIFLTDDTIRITFHLNDMVDRLGRKLMSGDVLELPHLREYFGLDESKSAVNRFYVVEDASYPAEGFSPRWWNHMWRVKAKMITDSPEFDDILSRSVNEDGTIGPGTADDCCDESLRDILSQGGRDAEITDGIIAQAQRDVQYDPLWYRADHLYVQIHPDGTPNLIYWKTGDGAPPNGIQLSGSGDTFTDDLSVGDYFLRTDFAPPVLFQKSTNCKFMRIEVDQRKLPWTAQNKLLDTFTENTNTITNDDGTSVPSKQALSKLIKPRPKS